MTPLLSLLTPAEMVLLLDKSQGTCEQCSKHGLMYLQYTGGVDPTVWHLCSEHHQEPTLKYLSINEEFLYFLQEPEAPTYEEHLRVINEATEASYEASREPDVSA